MKIDELIKLAELRVQILELQSKSMTPAGIVALDLLAKQLQTMEKLTTPSPQLLKGKRGHLVIAGKGINCPTKEPITFVITEVNFLIASHLPLEAFSINPDYPEDVQERRYHKDVREQLKVQNNAKPDCFVPELLINSEPTGLNGMPVITKDGLVLSGNGRSMILQLIYSKHPASATAYKRLLRKLVEPLAGIDASSSRFRRFKRPVLVRVMETKGRTRAQLAELVRVFNQNLTQEMDPVTSSIAHGRRVSDRIIDRLNAMKDEQTFLVFVRDDPFFLKIVQEEGLIPKEMMGRFVERDRIKGLDRLTREGAAFIQNALLGKAIPDPVSIELLHSNLKDSLTRSVPFILQAATGNVTNPAKWNPLPALSHAIRLWSVARTNNQTSMRSYVDQLALFPLDESVKLNEASAVIATALLQRPGIRQQPSGWKKYASIVQASNSISLVEEIPVTAFGGAFGLERSSYTGLGITPAKTFEGFK